MVSSLFLAVLVSGNQTINPLLMLTLWGGSGLGSQILRSFSRDSEIFLLRNSSMRRAGIFFFFLLMNWLKTDNSENDTSGGRESPP